MYDIQSGQGLLSLLLYDKEFTDKVMCLCFTMHFPLLNQFAIITESMNVYLNAYNEIFLIEILICYTYFM